MPRIIRHALFEKLGQLPEWITFREDFHAATGLRLKLVDELGRRTTSSPYQADLCCRMEANPTGRIYCERFRQAMLADIVDAPVCATCDAGLTEVAVPLQISGMRVGYLLFLGFRFTQAEESDLKRARHLLDKAGIDVPPEVLEGGLRGTPVIAPRAGEAYTRFVEMAARQISEKLTAHLNKPQDVLPPLVRRACALIQREALMVDIDLEYVARQCAVSAGHLSRIFHRSTGLTFREYVVRLRAERARDLIRHSAKSITEICFESGFQSISQFNRVFRRVHGCAPRDLRPG